MSKFLLFIATLAVALTAVGAASAHTTKSWYVTQTRHGGYECEKSINENDQIVAGPFDSKEQCEAVLTPTFGVVCLYGELEIETPYPNLYIYQHGGTLGNCPVNPPATAGPPAPPQTNGNFLCYSIGGNVYVAPDEATFKLLRDAGYWLPTAVPGVVDGGTNVGSYHLICAPPVAGSTTGPFVDTGQTYVDNNGMTLDFHSADSTDWVGVYLNGS